MILFSQFFILLLLINISSGKNDNSCYSSTGIPLPCEPPLQNLGQHKPTFGNSVCGSKGPETICTKWTDEFGNLQTSCEICDNNVPDQKHSFDLINDRPKNGKETCWYSEAILDNRTPKNVNVTIDLKKRSLVFYVLLELCGDFPDGIVISKKSHVDSHWTPWQYYGNECLNLFGMEEITSETIKSISYYDRLKPICFNLEKSIEYEKSGKISRLLPFNPTLGRNYESVPTIEEQDWLTASSLQFTYVSFSKLAFINSFLADKPIINKYFGASNVVVGGRPLCNGHSHRVISTANGTLLCECHHSTTGVDCEKCNEEFNDQPWTPAFGNKVSTCKRCECNNHAKKCAFDIDIYMKSNKKHGSKCQQCMDNTIGPQCEKCSPGYYRNHVYPIYHKNACIPCFCHSIGSYPEKPCDALTGKCLCKTGVTGSTCNECIQGYQQTKSHENPCKKNGHRRSIKSDNPTCEFCQKRPKKITFKRYCKKDLSIKVTVKSHESRNQWIRFHLYVKDTWLHTTPPSSYDQFIIGGDNTINIWVRKEAIECHCLNMEFNKSYLIMTNIKTQSFMGLEELMISRKSLLEEWNEEFNDQFSEFKEMESAGKCIEFKRRKRNIKSKGSQYSFNRYVSSVK